jgi:hypothetical protein
VSQDVPLTWVKVSETVVGPDQKERTLERYVDLSEVSKHTARPKTSPRERLVGIVTHGDTVLVPASKVLKALESMKRADEDLA